MYDYVHDVQLPRTGGVNDQFGYTVSGLRRLKPELKKQFYIHIDSIMTCILVKIHFFILAVSFQFFMALKTLKVSICPFSPT